VIVPQYQVIPWFWRNAWALELNFECRAIPLPGKAWIGLDRPEISSELDGLGSRFTGEKSNLLWYHSVLTPPIPKALVAESLWKPLKIS
jgi:hypothetical protein